MHWRRKWQPTPVFLPRESQGRGSLVGYRLWGRTQLDTTERLTWTCMKCSLGISNFLDEIFSLFHSIVFLFYNNTQKHKMFEGINLAKYLQALQKENFRTQLREIKDLISGEITILIGRFSIIKIALLPKLISRFKAVFIKILAACFAEIGK